MVLVERGVKPLILNAEKFELLEYEPATLSAETEFFIETTYKASFKFHNKLSFSRTLKLPDSQFKFHPGGTDSLEFKKGPSEVFKIIFSPVQEGEVEFSLILEKKSREFAEKILDRKLQVKKAIVKIESQIEGLPASMKLGQKAEVNFRFTNRGNQTVRGINIEIKQMEF